jgi:transposase InsO family protein
VHVFGARSSPSIANFALKQAAEDYAQSSQVKNVISRNFYVDDLLLSAATGNEALALAEQVKETLAQGGFNLTSFAMNSTELKCPSSLPLVTSEMQSIKALGLNWHLHTDVFNFDGAELQLVVAPTRREILRNVASIYDPLGLISPVLVHAKKLFQETCRLKLNWDDPLPRSLLESWKRWQENLESLEYKVPRNLKIYVKGDPTRKELHVFCDGSETAYGAVAYLRYITHKSVALSPPVFAKARLTPLNNTTLRTIPRIELCAAKLAVEIASILTNEMEQPVDKTTFWTDSTTVLAYIKNENRRFQRFVANKVAFIRNHSASEDWFHVASKENPADLVSRGVTPDNLANSNMWNKGPDFLSKIEFEATPQIYHVQDSDCEVKSDTKVCTTSTARPPFQTLLESSSSWYGVRCRVAWLLRFVKHLRGRNEEFGRLRVLEIAKAEEAIWKFVQTNELPSAIPCKGLSSMNNILRNLNPFTDEKGLLRVGGRLKNCSLKYETKHPIILPGSSAVVQLMMRDSHVTFGHLGRATMLSHLRRKYWIIGGNKFVKKIVKDCLSCRKYHARPCQPMMADLPVNRVLGDCAPFTNTGVDYFGPFLTIHGRRSEKRYGVIFTCLSSRALHLELSHSLTTDSFIHALRRFVSRRGNVASLISDNGTNFTGANAELRRVIEQWNSEHIEGWLKQKGISWKFNPPYSSHYGGVWEREIRSVRKVLTALMNEQKVKLTDEALQTLLCEVESILNHRPLTPVTDDPQDCDALTPNHLPLLNATNSFPPGLFSNHDSYHKRRWKQGQYLSDLFRQR